MKHHRSQLKNDGFTLVEILIVVVILGILAAVIVPSFAFAADDARRSAFVADIKQYSDAAHLYSVQQGQYLPDGGSGTVPEGFEEYINAEGWLDGTPVGGVWDAEFESFGVTSAIGVHFQDANRRNDEFMSLIDASYDDGNLEGRLFQRISGDRYYHIIER